MSTSRPYEAVQVISSELIAPQQQTVFTPGMLTYERHVRSKLVCAYDAALTQKIVGVHVIMKSMQTANTVVDMLLLKRERCREHIYNGRLNYRLAVSAKFVLT